MTTPITPKKRAAAKRAAAKQSASNRSIIRNNSGKGVPSSANGGQAAFHIKAEPAALKVDARQTEHVECNCVPDLGPSHCHLCGEAAGRPVSWADSHPDIPDEGEVVPEPEAATEVEAEPEPEPETDEYGNLMGRGGFARDGRGSALVVTLDPENDQYKSGPKKGKPKLYPYMSPSGFGVQSSTAGLDIWKQNRLLLATMRDPSLAERLTQAMGDLDPDSDEGKKVFTAFRDEMHDIAETDIAARKGTFSHWLTEVQDQGESPLEGLRQGAALGIDPDMSARIMEGWDEINKEYGFESVAVETKLVNDELKTAGTTDRITRLTKPLTVDLGDGPVTLLPGTHIVVDFKSGKLRQNAKGSPQYWQKYTSQLAAYAGSVPYDAKNHKRLSWKDIGVTSTPSQEVAVIIHGDLEALADGTSEKTPREAFSVFALDLKKGREYALASNALRASERSANTAFAPATVTQAG